MKKQRKMGKLQLLNSFLNQVGFKLEKYNVQSDFSLRQKQFFNTNQISLILDVGANTGIFGKKMKGIGYKNQIVSFEPLSTAFSLLEKEAKKHINWTVFNYALGNENIKQIINISANSHSSSILDILDAHTDAESSASYIAKEEIEIKTLDSIATEVGIYNHQEIFLKPFG